MAYLINRYKILYSVEISIYNYFKFKIFGCGSLFYNTDVNILAFHVSKNTVYKIFDILYLEIINRFISVTTSNKIVI